MKSLTRYSCAVSSCSEFTVEMSELSKAEVIFGCTSNFVSNKVLVSRDSARNLTGMLGHFSLVTSLDVDDHELYDSEICKFVLLI